jgi:hypothetical protein
LISKALKFSINRHAGFRRSSPVSITPAPAHCHTRCLRHRCIPGSVIPKDSITDLIFAVSRSASFRQHIKTTRLPSLLKSRLRNA